MLLAEDCRKPYSQHSAQLSPAHALRRTWRSTYCRARPSIITGPRNTNTIAGHPQHSHHYFGRREHPTIGDAPGTIRAGGSRSPDHHMGPGPSTSTHTGVASTPPPGTIPAGGPAPIRTARARPGRGLTHQAAGHYRLIYDTQLKGSPEHTTTTRASRCHPHRLAAEHYRGRRAGGRMAGVLEHTSHLIRISDFHAAGSWPYTLGCTHSPTRPGHCQWAGGQFRITQGTRGQHLISRKAGGPEHTQA